MAVCHDGIAYTHEWSLSLGCLAQLSATRMEVPPLCRNSSRAMDPWVPLLLLPSWLGALVWGTICPLHQAYLCKEATAPFHLCVPTISLMVFKKQSVLNETNVPMSWRVCCWGRGNHPSVEGGKRETKAENRLEGPPKDSRLTTSHRNRVFHARLLLRMIFVMKG